ncbi:glycine betaine ABC transporter substrate-binding protein [Pseudomonas kermanshahensis]|uniref:glycine betaine ABC transporter substrate-binding protein n=1 Tax=Pseudomonas kermanshahensis TaxID=2745482 RepID=UPI0023DA6963|nr:glycine betaine ABC transporter substrate-binding protein [Pseudomonas kermanshahensis]WEL57573.1 glycine betaine ABC transporter substrate-binding protein [Pseudomonas kermanshahensis]
MNKGFVSTSLAVGVFATAFAASAQDCGRVTIASMNWQSAEVLSNIDKLILETGYGCEAEITFGDTVPTITSMVEKGSPDIAPEAWIDLLPDVVRKGLDSKQLVATPKVLSEGGVSGWWIPKYFADAHPDIKTIADVLKHPELFPSPEDPSKGAIYNGAQGWGWTGITTQLFKAFKAEDSGFVLVDTGSAAGLDGSLIKAYERKKGWVGYYWSPTALLGKYPMVQLQPGVPYDEAEWKRCITVANCPDPKPTGWPIDRVVTLASAPFAKRVNPEVMEYLNKRVWDNNFVNQLMAWMTDNQATGADAAKHFLRHNQSVWMPWVSAEAAKKIHESL